MNNTNKILRFFISTLATLTMALVMLLPAGSASARAVSDEMPIYFLRSADCTGEVVEISGTIHVVNQIQADGSVMGHFNYRDVTGLGLTSGGTYRVSAVDNIRLSAPFPSSITSVQSFHLISRGSGGNLLVQVSYHITVNGNGQVQAFIEALSMQCT